MTMQLRSLIDKARTVTMTDEQKEAQRVSFVYGDTKIDNRHVTRKSVKKESCRNENHPHT